MSGHGSEEKNFQLLLGLKASPIQFIAQRYATEISRLVISTGNKTKQFTAL